MFLIFFRSFLEVIKQRKLHPVGDNVLDEETGINIGIPGVLFYRLPHKVSSVKMLFFEFSFKNVKSCFKYSFLPLINYFYN